jgi:antirestriction protein ArdC
MARTSSGASVRPDLYGEVTARIIADLEAGTVPWVQPWANASAPLDLPANAVTGRRYAGINILLLWIAGLDRGFTTQRWLTFRQALTAGGAVRRGERGTTIFYAARFTPEESGDEGGDESGPREIRFLKRFTVFNIDQCDGRPEQCEARREHLPEEVIVEDAEAVLAASGVDWQISGTHEAFYSTALDLIVVPPRRVYYDPINAYRTLLHELTHATGHEKRLGRDLAQPFGSDGYAREELIAELGSAFLCAALGIVPTVRHADYIAGWLEILRGDDRAIFRAASAGSAAADWLLARRDRMVEQLRAAETGEDRAAA